MTESRKILIVEDSPTMCGLYRIALEPYGRELVFASNGVEGLDLAAAETQLSLVIVDINMPRMDGIEFLRRLRGELRAEVPALVISTESAEHDREEARLAGANGYLPKPWKPQELLETVAQLEAPARTT
jgi:two-component system, chemotaxis family, chemotaxis protein CheY